MVTEVKAPNHVHYSPSKQSVFLAGGITGCPDWQAKMVWYLDALHITVINPRRDEFDVTNPAVSRQQIEWEFDHILRADLTLFWFPKETLCPITLYELGRAMTHYSQTIRNSPSWRPFPIIGTHPEYARRMDVMIQTNLIAQEKLRQCEIFSSLEDVALDIYKAFSVPVPKYIKQRLGR